LKVEDIFSAWLSTAYTCSFQTELEQNIAVSRYFREADNCEPAPHNVHRPTGA